MLTVSTARQETVARYCMMAMQAGISAGMPLAEARALCPDAHAIPFDFDKSRQAMASLAKWCFRFSPVVMVDPIAGAAPEDDVPDGLLLDVTGAGHLFGGEHLLLTDIAARLSRAGFGTRLAVGPTIGAAWALSHFGPHAAMRVDERSLNDALRGLPIAALRLPAKANTGLREVGIERIEHLLRLPRESLPARFGAEVLRRLDQTFGRVRESLSPFRVCEPLQVRRMFEGATTQLEALTLTVQKLIGELTAQLAQKESGVRGLRLEWIRFNAAAVSREFILAKPNRDPKHLWKLMEPKIETMHMGYGVEGVVLAAYWTQRMPHIQGDVWGDDPWKQEEEFSELLDRLMNRWGKERVLAAHPVASHTPEMARQFRPAGGAHSQAQVISHERPSVLFERPEEAEAIALLPDHAPGWLRWRGQDHRLDGGSAPERIVTAWWGDSSDRKRKTASTRDYFKVRTRDATWLWVFRELESGQWFVHGIWA